MVRVIVRRRAAVAFVAVAAALAGCTGGNGDESVSTGGADSGIAPIESTLPTDVPAAPAADPASSEPADGTATQGDETTPAVEVPEALRFTAPAVGGGEIDAASFAGKPTVFWFWAPT